MLGLCWTPASVQSMQKVAATMPSNPEQLLGAILVRKDIFNRFETTMHDTCLDANNLLEYLFSLYNSTAAPAERENIPSGQVLGFMHKDTNCTKKAVGRGQLVFPNQPVIGNSHFPQQNIQARPSESRPHQSGVIEGHRKKMKLEQTSFQGNINLAANHQDYNHTVSLKPFDNHSNFSGANSNQTSSIKREVTPSEVESCHAQPPPSSLPPFSQICRQGSRPYSPASAQYAEALATPQHKDGHKNFNMNIRADHSSAELKNEIDGTHPGVLGDHQAQKNVQNPHKFVKKSKNKGSSDLSTVGTNSSNAERSGRKKKTHQCFCGALFTRADNLKRHIRKCHKEKLGEGTTLESHVDNSGLPLANDFSHAFPSGGQDGIEASQPLSSHSSQQHQAQHHQQQQQREDHHHHHQQREDHHHQPQDNSVVKSTPGVKWSCFCGENFDDHFRLVQHTRTHDSSM